MYGSSNVNSIMNSGLDNNVAYSNILSNISRQQQQAHGSEFHGHIANINHHQHHQHAHAHPSYNSYNYNTNNNGQYGRVGHNNHNHTHIQNHQYRTTQNFYQSQNQNREQVQESEKRNGSSQIRKLQKSFTTPEDNQIENQEIQEIFKCFICFSVVKDAQMCPHCSKLCCGPCIKKWLIEQKSSCPHCRAQLHVRQLVNCRFVSEVTTALVKAQIQQPKTSMQDQDFCEKHKDNQIKYFCSTCQVPICSDCAMLSSDHKEHKFEQIVDVYDACMASVNQEFYKIKSKLSLLQGQQTDLDNRIDQIEDAKEKSSQQIKEITDNMYAKLDNALQKKVKKIQTCQDLLTEEITFLQSMTNDIQKQIRETARSAFIGKGQELCAMLQEVNAKPMRTFEIQQSTLHFKSCLVPEYDGDTFVIQNFSQVVKNEELLYSDSKLINGITWRMKVYPNGNGTSLGQFISVFLEMEKGVRKTQSKYQYKIEMICQKLPEEEEETKFEETETENNSNAFKDKLREKRVTREFSSEFTPGECWGYNKFYNLSKIQSDGFHCIESGDRLILKYYVRACSYKQESSDLKRYITEQQEQWRQQQGTLNKIEVEDEVVVSSHEKENQQSAFIKEQSSQKKSVESSNTKKVQKKVLSDPSSMSQKKTALTENNFVQNNAVVQQFQFQSIGNGHNINNKNETMQSGVQQLQQKRNDENLQQQKNLQKQKQNQKQFQNQKEKLQNEEKEIMMEPSQKRIESFDQMDEIMEQIDGLCNLNEDDLMAQNGAQSVQSNALNYQSSLQADFSDCEANNNNNNINNNDNANNAIHISQNQEMEVFSDDDENVDQQQRNYDECNSNGLDSFNDSDEEEQEEQGAASPSPSSNMQIRSYQHAHEDEEEEHKMDTEIINNVRGYLNLHNQQSQQDNYNDQQHEYDDLDDDMALALRISEQEANIQHLNDELDQKATKSNLLPQFEMEHLIERQKKIQQQIEMFTSNKQF